MEIGTHGMAEVIGTGATGIAGTIGIRIIGTRIIMACANAWWPRVVESAAVVVCYKELGGKDAFLASN